MPVKIVQHVNGDRTLVVQEPDLPRNQPWMAKALCYIRKLDTELFFQKPTPAIVFDTCNACPVRKECLAYSYVAEKDNWKQGVWGGYTARQRTNLAKGKKVNKVRSAKDLARQRQYKKQWHVDRKKKDEENATKE